PCILTCAAGGSPAASRSSVSSCSRGSTRARARHGRAGSGCGSVGGSARRASSVTPLRSTKRSGIPITRTSWSEELRMANVAGYLTVKNFERFQHYKDRNPPWIKLYNDLLDDYEFGR